MRLLLTCAWTLATATVVLIEEFAGDGQAGARGDGGPATAAELRYPLSVVPVLVAGGPAPAASVLIVDTGNSVVRVVLKGVITRFAGDGTSGFSGDGGPPTSAQLSRPAGACIDAGGTVYVVDAGNSRVRAIRTTGDGVAIFTVAGSAVPGDSGDDGPATLAQLNSPSSCAVDVLGRLLIADTANARVRAVSPGGYITTAAGTGVPGFAGEGGPATAALLNSPRGLCVSPSGGFFVSDTGNDRVRFVSDSPSVGATITTFAGSGDPTFVGDGGPATAAGINGPTGVLALGGFVYIADSGHGRVRVVDATGIITTAVGNGRDTSGGDGGPPTAASLAHPQGLGAGAAGELFIADTNGTRVRVVGRLVLVSASGTPSRTASPSPSASATLTPSSSRTGTPSPSVTLTVTPTASPSASASRPPWHTATQTPAPAGPPESGCPMASCGVPVTIGVVAAAATAAAALLCWRRGRRPGTADDADAEADIDADTEPLIGTTGTDEGVLWSVDRPVI